MGSKKKKTRVVPIKEEDKGNPIRFSGGKYAGLTGWLEKDVEPTTCYTSVIVDKGVKDGVACGIYTAVKHRNVGTPNRKPKSYEELLLHKILTFVRANEQYSSHEGVPGLPAVECV